MGGERTTRDYPGIAVEEREIGGLLVDYAAAERKVYSELGIFIPGSGLTSKSGLLILERLREHGYDSLSLNLRGRRGEMQQQDFANRGMKDFNLDVRGLREALVRQGVPYDRHILIGHSAGGLTAMEQAREHNPATLILLAPGTPRAFPMGQLSATERQQIQATIASNKIIRRDKNSFLSWFGGRIPPDFETDYDKRYAPMLGFESHRARNEAYADPVDIQPQDVTCPTLVVGATYDNRVSPELCRRLAGYLHSDYMEMEAGHLLMLEEQWPVFAGQVLEWLDRKCSQS